MRRSRSHPDWDIHQSSSSVILGPEDPKVVVKTHDDLPNEDDLVSLEASLNRRHPHDSESFPVILILQSLYTDSVHSLERFQR